jgi:hypothetical protein
MSVPLLQTLAAVVVLVVCVPAFVVVAASRL